VYLSAFVYVRACVCLSLCNICPIFFSLLFCSVFASPPTPRYLVLPPIAPSFSCSYTPTHSFIHSFILPFLAYFLLPFSLTLSLFLSLSRLLAFFLSFFRVCCYSSLLFPSPFFFLGAFPSCSLSINPFLRLEIGLGVWIFFFSGFPSSISYCLSSSLSHVTVVCLFVCILGLSCFVFVFFFFYVFCIIGFFSGTFRWCGI
jgi:hypothetical protein